MGRFLLGTKLWVVLHVAAITFFFWLGHIIHFEK